MPEKHERPQPLHVTENLLTADWLIGAGYSDSLVRPASLFPGAWRSPARTRSNTEEAGARTGMSR